MSGKERKIYLMGVDSHGLSAETQQLADQAALIVGGKRLLALLPADCRVACQAVTPLAAACAAMGLALAQGDVVVLASGDPLFFGIGRRLLAEFGQDTVVIRPALSAMQEAAALFGLPWDDAALLSLHGRSNDHLPGLLLRHPKTFLFTDQHNSPKALAAELLAYLTLIGDKTLDCQVLVAENIGSGNQRLFRGSLAAAAKENFPLLNVMGLLVARIEPAGSFGLREDEIQHSRGLITKDEVRAVTLHKLQLPSRGVLWDVGAGSGSIALEAARLNPDLIIYAIEKKAEELANIKANIRRFGCFNIIPVAGLAAEVLADLPRPQRIFVGGNGGQLAAIIKTAGQRLPDGGRIVVNGVIQPTIKAVPLLLTEHGFSVTMTEMKITRTDETDELVVLNPITIMVGSK